MKATTVKVDGELLAGIDAAREPGQSVAAYVRRALQRDLERRLARDAAAAFKDFVETHPEEKQWLDEWDGADLASAPRRRSSWNGSIAHLRSPSAAEALGRIRRRARLPARWLRADGRARSPCSPAGRR